MSVGNLLLRVVLMLSLLLNGLNVAMAGPMALALATPVTTEAAPPCHADAPVPMPAMHHDHSASAGVEAALQAPHDGDHCKIKDCLRSCAQQPGMTVAIAWLPSPPPLWPSPVSAPGQSLPTPPLDRITRPPIS